MNFKTLLLLSLVLLAFASCKDDDDAVSKKTLLETPTWAWRASVESGTTTTYTIADCEYDDTAKFAGSVLTYDANDDTACFGVADETPIPVPYTYEEATNLLIINFFGTSDTSTVTRLTSTELWFMDSEGDEERYLAL